MQPHVRPHTHTHARTHFPHTALLAERTHMCRMPESLGPLCCELLSDTSSELKSLLSRTRFLYGPDLESLMRSLAFNLLDEVQECELVVQEEWVGAGNAMPRR